MKFTFKKEDQSGVIGVETEADTLEDVVQEFEKFLKASGFEFGNAKFCLIDFDSFEEEIEDYFDLNDIDDEDDGFKQ